MNTSKQIIVIVALVFVSVLATGAYTMWDPSRSNQAKDAQLARTIDRGAFLFAQNCRVCHGDAGEGGQAANRLNIKGVAVAPALNRPDLQGVDPKTGQVTEQNKTQASNLIFNTITCGRVGKAMPTWGQSQGGTLNDEQIRQLATFITEGTGWNIAKVYAREGDERYHINGDASDGIKLTRDLDATSTTVYLNLVDPLGAGSRLQIYAGDPLDPNSPSEIMTLTADPFRASLTVQRGADGTTATEHKLKNDQKTPIAISGTGVRLGSPLDASSTTINVADVSAFKAGDTIQIEGEKMVVTEVDPNPHVIVERHSGTTKAAAHAAGATVFKPPVPGTAANPPATVAAACGQQAAAPQPTAPATPATPATAFTVVGQSTAFDVVTLTAVAGAPLTVTFDNKDAGTAHNIHFFQGTDATGTSVGETALEAGPVTQTLNFGPLSAGTYYYRCDVHPGQMEGALTAVAAGAPGGTPAAAAPAGAATAPPG